MSKSETVPKILRPFSFLGVDFDLKSRSSQGTGVCPFCGKEGKWSVSVEAGLWDCKSCGANGNPITFIRQLHEASLLYTTPEEYVELQDHRKLLNPETPKQWGCCKSIINNKWLIPGYGTGGKLDQLYVLSKIFNVTKKILEEKLLPTPGLHEDGSVHALVGVPLTDPSIPDYYVCEGWGDGMCFWEVLKLTKTKGNVVAVPGANIFQEAWHYLFINKNVKLMYDNDHPRLVAKRVIAGAGLSGSERVAKILSSQSNKPKSIEWLQWGTPPGPSIADDGFNKELKHGYDLRDFFSGPQQVRVEALPKLLALVSPVPEEWLSKSSIPVEAKVCPLHCESWSELIEAMRKALQCRQEIIDVFSVMCAVSASTSQAGDQLFLQVIADAGSAKTKMCDALTVSKGNYPLDHLTGFISGFNDGTGKDYSLISRINHKCLITAEGDTLVSSQMFGEIMSQQRRIFDGTSGAEYKNRDSAMRYEGLRTPWILVGTPVTMLACDQSRLGDRFIKIFIGKPSEDELDSILDRVFYSAMKSVDTKSNGQAGSQVEENMLLFHRLTGGYIDHVRMNIEEKLIAVKWDEKVLKVLKSLAKFAAMFRARPDPDWRKETVNTKELPTRLLHQFARLSKCLAVVREESSISTDILRIMKKIAFDTASGKTLNLAKFVQKYQSQGVTTAIICTHTGKREEQEMHLLRFMRDIGIIEPFVNHTQLMKSSVVKWRLTKSTLALLEAVESINHASH